MKVIFLHIFLIGFVSGTLLLETEWKDYKKNFKKEFKTAYEQKVARSNWLLNRQRVNNHNARFKRGYYTYELALNAFSDQTFPAFASSFPSIVVDQTLTRPAKIITQTPKSNFSYTQLDLISAVKEQTLNCNSGWAFATASVLDIAIQYSDPAIKPQNYSVQQFIDCAGMGTGCTIGLPHHILEYVALGQPIATDAEYGYKFNGEIGFCLVPDTAKPLDITGYNTLQDGNDDQLFKTVGLLSPVIVDINPKSFEFMHYKSGIFQQPRLPQAGSHFMTVIGYDSDCWLLQNSFGTQWGNKGYMLIERNPAKPITKSAVFPTL